MGRATALALARAGVDVAIGSLVRSQREERVLPGQNAHTPDDHELETTREAIASTGVAALAQPLDIADDDSVQSIVDATLDAFGKIDILINAGGTSARRLMTEPQDDLWYRLIDVNLNGAYRTIRRCMPGMLERRWGRIVNFSSTAGLVGFERHAAYCASKTGLLGLTRCVALEGARHGVTCNAICPGWVETDSARSAAVQEMAIAGITDMSIEEYFAQAARKFVPQNRMIRPEEPAALVAYLCRDEALGITGETLRMSAGSHW